MKRAFIVSAIFCALTFTISAQSNENPNPSPPKESSPEKVAHDEAVGKVKAGQNAAAKDQQKTEHPIVEPSPVDPSKNEPKPANIPTDGSDIIKSDKPAPVLVQPK